MGLGDTIRTLAQMPTLLTLKKGWFRERPMLLIVFRLRVEANAVRFGQRLAIVFEGRTLTWSELNEEANRYAQYFKRQGLERGDTVSLIGKSRRILGATHRSQ